MNGAEKQSLMNAGEHDVRNTAEEWLDIINSLNDPDMLFLIADSLCSTDIVKNCDEKSNAKVEVKMDRFQIARYALDKFIRFAGGGGADGAGKLFERLLSDSNKADLLELKLEAIDLIVGRMNLEELRHLQIFLNAYRNFLPRELFKIKLEDVFNTITALEKTREIKAFFRDSATGIINDDD